MYKDKTILAIITARGGSKGLPGKNIKEIGGKPLIGWTLEQAKASRYIDYIFVSTDSKEIAAVSERFAVAVPELRPDELAQDTTPSTDVIEYIISHLESENKYFDYFILLEPTSPLRKGNDIDTIIEMAVNHLEFDGVISVGEVHTEHPLIIKKVSQLGKLIPYIENEKEVYQRQQHDKAYFPYGVGYLEKVDVFKKNHTIYTDNVLPYFIERWQNYEIDDIYDFICVESIMKYIHHREENK